MAVARPTPEAAPVIRALAPLRKTAVGAGILDDDCDMKEMIQWRQFEKETCTVLDPTLILFEAVKMTSGGAIVSLFAILSP